MSSFQRKAIITLIEKQHKDQTLIHNWRLISLINVDAKIISKAIAWKFKKKKVPPNITHHNQTGYVEDRYIGETIRSILDIKEFTDFKNISGISWFSSTLKRLSTL